MGSWYHISSSSKKPFHRIDGKCCSQSHKNGVILTSEKIVLSLQTVGLATFLL